MVAWGRACVGSAWAGSVLAGAIRVGLLVVGLSAVVLTTTAAVAQQQSALPRIYTNEAYVEESIVAPTLVVDNPMAVFAYVLGHLPDRVKVYPTENYYYFSFVHNHVRYAGNIRLDVVDRDEGKVNFAYYPDLAEWKDEDPIVYRLLDASFGVRVEKVEPLVYRISYGGKSVVFELNDLRGVKPRDGTLGPDEVYIGPVFDESAMRFFLVFNRKLKVFHYVLDETIAIADQLVRIPDSDRILIGKRTGFAYYRDHRIDRKLLIGVFEGNSRVNNYFDGPFDQLPDNFIEGETLREAILAVDPKLAGKIDRFGISPGGQDRYLIAPYRHYRNDDDLLAFHTCATNKRIPAARYYECFVYDDDAGLLQAEIHTPPKSTVRGRPKKTAGKKP
jgi:hypothetical protein